MRTDIHPSLSLIHISKVKIEVVVSKIPVASVIETTKKALYTGHIGDGKIFVYNVDQVVKVLSLIHICGDSPHIKNHNQGDDGKRPSGYV